MADKGGTDCAICAEDLQVVWQGRPAAVLPVVPGSLIENRDYAFSPDPRFIWYGPPKARGLLVWGHGKSWPGLDLPAIQPQAHVRAFNNAEFDVVRLVRPPTDYVDGAAEWLPSGLALLRQKGWRMGGGSQPIARCMQQRARDTSGLADAAIADSPASFSGQATQEADLPRNLRAIRSQFARVGVVQSEGDFYVRDTPGRVAMLREMLPSRVAAALVIDEPEGIIGHSGGFSADFARKFSPIPAGVRDRARAADGLRAEVAQIAECVVVGPGQRLSGLVGAKFSAQYAATTLKSSWSAKADHPAFTWRTQVVDGRLRRPSR
jgi:hypothetical protein